MQSAGVSPNLQIPFFPGKSQNLAAVPPAFEEVRTLLAGSAGLVLDQIARVYEDLRRVFEQEHPSGKYSIALTLELPKGWDERFHSLRMSPPPQGKQSHRIHQGLLPPGAADSPAALRFRANWERDGREDGGNIVDEAMSNKIT